MIAPTKKVSKTQSRRKNREWQRRKLKQLNNTIKLAVNPDSGEVHLSHRVTPKGWYRGKQVFVFKAKVKETIVDAE